MTHTCDPGFMLAGADVRECVLSDPSTGVWSEPLPICNRKFLSFLYRKCIYESLYAAIDCGNPGMPENGATTGATTTFDSVVTHTCNDGFVLVGADERRCLESGNWSAPLPSCESKARL